MLQRSTYTFLVSILFSPTIHFLAILCFNKLLCQTEALVRHLKVERNKSYIFFSVSSTHNCSRGLLRTPAGDCGTQPPSSRTWSSAGSWETTLCVSLFQQQPGGGSPSSNEASNELPRPPALGEPCFNLEAGTFSSFGTSSPSVIMVINSLQSLSHCLY